MTGDGGGFTSMGSTAADIARDLYVELNSRLAERAVAHAPVYPSWMTIIPSKSKSQRFNFAHALATVREFLGERVYNKIASYDYELANKDWESSIEWKRDDLEDDQTGSLQLGIDEYINAMLEHPDALAVQFLNHQIAGTSSTFGLGFDGKVAFSATHAWPSGYTTNQSNLLSGSNTGKLDLTYGYDNIQTAYRKMADGFYWPYGDGGEIGRIQNNGPYTLLASSSVYFNARRLLTSQEVVSGSTSTYGLPASNVLNSLGIQTILVPGMTAGYWVLADLSAPTRFGIFQRRKEIEQEFMGPGTELWFKNRIARTGAFARYNIGQGFWFRAVAGDGT